MAECPIKNCDWRGKKAGVAVHLGRVHKLRFQHEEIASESKARPEIATVEMCPVPFCHYRSTPESVRDHLESKHPEWRMSDGRFVFEVV